MLKRKHFQKLQAWAKRKRRKPLIVQGARQVGKTFLIREFARAQYPQVIELNFVEHPHYKDIFAESLDATTIKKNLSLQFPTVDFGDSKWLLFLDEIQDCPNARTALKFLSEQSEFDVIASGSMLGIKHKEVQSYPVGAVEYLPMHSLDFEEFLWAKGYSAKAVDIVRESFEKRRPLPEAAHRKMLENLREYIVIGGMPAVCQTFVNNQNFGEALRLQRAILTDYQADIIKYAEKTEKQRVLDCFLSVPRQLAKANKKFQYSVVEKRGTSKKYGGSLLWLLDAGIINFCHNLARPEVPLSGFKIADEFKIYLQDIGFLTAMLDDGTQKDIIANNLAIYKGAIYENLIADIFTKAEKPLYYFSHRGSLEMDFIINFEETAAAVEVKSSENTKAKSLRSIMTNWGVPVGLKLSTKNLSLSPGGKVLNLPLYMAMFL